MVRTLFVALLLLVGCDQPEGWRPTAVPLVVTLPSDATEAQVAALEAGADRWREELGAEVISLRLTDDAPRCGRVNVRFEAMPGVANGTTIRQRCRATIVLQDGLAPGYAAVVAAHELGHALGLDHDEERGSLMFSSAPRDGGYLTERAVSYVAALLELAQGPRR